MLTVSDNCLYAASQSAQWYAVSEISPAVSEISAPASARLHAVLEMSFADSDISFAVQQNSLAYHQGYHLHSEICH